MGFVYHLNGILNGMNVTIDKAGRLVVPKEIRDRMGLRAGDELEIEEYNGKIELSKPRKERKLIENEHGLLTLEPDPNAPPVTAEEIREELERVREWPHR
jgi:AbrB family looped-hinge helix DNA binding protein